MNDEQIRVLSEQSKELLAMLDTEENKYRSVHELHEEAYAEHAHLKVVAEEHKEVKTRAQQDIATTNADVAKTRTQLKHSQDESEQLRLQCHTLASQTKVRN